MSSAASPHNDVTARASGSARRPFEVIDALRALRELRREKADWRKLLAEAPHHRGNPPEWFDQQDDYLDGLDYAIAVLSAPVSKPAPAPAVAPPTRSDPKPQPAAPTKPAPSAPPAPAHQGSLL